VGVVEGTTPALGFRIALGDAKDHMRSCEEDMKADPHVTYLENNAHLMQYARLRDAGLPVGSGVTEGACKSVVKKRTNNSGQRWRPEGLEAVLALRSVHMSERLPRFWAHFARGYRKEVTRCA